MVESEEFSACSTHGDLRDGQFFFYWKTTKRSPCEKSGCEWEDRIKLDLRATGCEGVNCIGLLRVGSNSGLLWTRS